MVFTTKINVFIALVSLTLFLFSLNSHAEPNALMCVDHYPPLQIIEKDGQVTGENVEVVKALTNKLNITLTFTQNTPFTRCIALSKRGKVDVMSGVLSSAERQQFSHLLLYDDLTTKRFFAKKNGPSIEQFDDLAGLNIATLRGVKQFKQFDNESALFTKTEVSSLTSGFLMLIKGHVDALITTEDYGLQWIKQSPQYRDAITPSAYKVTQDTQTYIAVSKLSPLAKHIDAIKAKAHQMFTSGEFTKIIIDFQNDHPNYYLAPKLNEQP